MSKNDTGTPETEVKTPEETVNSEEQVEESSEESEPTVGDLHEDTPVIKKDVPESVPRARLNKEIDKRKALEEKIEEMKKNEPSTEELSDDDLSTVDKLAKELEQIKQKEVTAAFNVKFEEHLAAALEQAPEFKGIINPDVIKQMVLNPANKDRTYIDLLEEGYGNSISGKRTTETTTPRGGAEDQKLDLERTQKDPEYLKEVLRDPILKAQYNEGLVDRLPL